MKNNHSRSPDKDDGFNPSSPAFQRLIDSFDAHVAVVNSSGRIVAVNMAWNQFALENGDPTLEHTGVGMNYLEVTRRAAKHGWQDMELIENAYQGIQQVLEGSLNSYSLKYSCHSPEVKRWFHMEVTPLEEPYALIKHVNITRQVQTELDVQEQKDQIHRQEQALQDRITRYQRLLELLPEAMFVHTDGIIQECNPACMQLFGATHPEQVIGKSVYDFIYPDFHSFVEERNRLMLQSHKPAPTIELSIVRLPGEVVPVEISATPFFASGVWSIQSVAHDLSAQKAVEQHVRISQQRLHFALEAGKIGSWEWNVESNTSYWNPMEFRLLGLSPEETPVPTELFFRHVHPDDLPGLQEALHNSLTTGEDFISEFRIFRADGQLRWLAARGQVVRDDILGNNTHLLGINYDITESLQHKAELARLDTAVRASADGIVITNSQGLIEWVNPAFSRMTGYTLEECVGQHTRLLKSNQTEPSVYTEMWQTITQGKVWRGRLRNRRKDGSLYTEQMMISPVVDAQGQIVNYIAIKEDITEKEELTHQLTQSQKMEAIGRLAGGVAHDFNNLLTIINGYSEMILGQTEQSDPLRNYIQAISDAGEKASRLTRQLLAFSRKTRQEVKVLNLNDTVTETEKMLRRLIGEDILLSSTLHPDLDPIKADPGQMVQVLMNLAVNARDAMPRGGELKISTENVVFDERVVVTRPTVNPGRFVLLTVTDTGCGMTQEVQSHIFEPFYTTKSADKGTGLGLATVYGVVTQSGGFIDVVSAPDQGTSFKIYLPVVDTPLILPDAQSLRSRSKGKETILLVEDDEAVRHLAQLGLQMYGYNVIQACNAEEAIERAAIFNGSIDLLVTDVVMPGLNGAELAARLLKHYPQLHVLYISGYTADAMVEYGVEQSQVKLLHKPFSPITLVAKVREIFDEKL